MRPLLVIIGSAALSVLLTGCLTVSQYKFSFDFQTGEVRREYYDIASKPAPDEKDYSIEKDWAALKQLAEEKKAEFDPDVVEDISRELFAEGSVLSGRKLHKIKCPKCFPSKAAILSYLHEKDWRFELVHDEVMLILPAGKKVVSTNGQSVATAGNSVIVWPRESSKFEYVVSEPFSGGTSLLPYYLKQRAGPK